MEILTKNKIYQLQNTIAENIRTGISSSQSDADNEMFLDIGADLLSNECDINVYLGIHHKDDTNVPHAGDKYEPNTNMGMMYMFTLTHENTPVSTEQLQKAIVCDAITTYYKKLGIDPKPELARTQDNMSVVIVGTSPATDPSLN